MSEYNIQMNKYNALNAEYDQLYPATKIENVDGLDTALQNNDPRNWGLGSMDGKMLTTDDDLDNIIINGWYSWVSPSPTNAPVQYGRMILFGYSNTVTQIVSSDMPGWKNILVMRSRFQGTWSPWEYVNPPMNLGVEYRTTERYLGKPVYTMAVYCGALPNTSGGITTTNTGITLADIDMRLSCVGCMYTSDAGSDKRSLPTNDGSILVAINHQKTGRVSEGTAQDSITVYTNSAGWGGYVAYALIKYTKYDN